MTRPDRRPLIVRAPVRAVVGVAILALVGVQWQQRTERRELRQFRDQVLEARATARECTRDLAISEGDFRALARGVDSLRATVDALESLNPRGVPAPRYEEYLTAVDAYNDGVERWLRGSARTWRAPWDAWV